MTSRPEDLYFNEAKYAIVVVSDGTITRAQIEDADGDVVGDGEARRAKGDRRNPKLGESLAVARAFEDAADQAYEAATELGWGMARITFTDEEVATLKEALAAITRTFPDTKP